MIMLGLGPHVGWPKCDRLAVAACGRQHARVATPRTMPHKENVWALQ
jgi:hypothetical protein